jgi:hypothetical protein
MAVVRTRNGRVDDYHVVVDWNSKRSTSALLARLTGRELPSDAKLIKPYNGFCAITEVGGCVASSGGRTSTCPRRNTPGGTACGQKLMSPQAGSRR